MESRGYVADVRHFNQVSSPEGVFENDVLRIDGGGDVKHLRIMLHVLTLERGFGLGFGSTAHQNVESFGALDFVLNHSDGGCFGHAELHIDREEGESIEEELAVLREGCVGEETERGLHF